MSTHKEFAEYILKNLHPSEKFKTRAMFGEYALYANNKVVALICDDMLYIKITPESSELEAVCEKDTPYKGAKLHYAIEEDQISHIEGLSSILLDIAKNREAPTPKKKTKNKSREKKNKR